MISRMSFRQNSVFHSINVEIARIFTCGTSAAASNYEPISPFITTILPNTAKLVFTFTVPLQHE